MNFKKVNNITGWAVFIVAFLTYFLTREARGSLWDCGEFVSSAYKVQLPHPPGAPLFVLLGRLFIILFGDKGATAASAVNFMSALASGATILFLFWSITHFARKMFVNVGEQLNSSQVFTVMAAGVVGGLAYTFSDSFWYSAVEGEVYALSSFFTALVFWIMLKWEQADVDAGNDSYAKARSDRWIVFLFFMMGLSIGVHLLNLLTIPAVVMIYYYRRYQASTKGAIIAFIIGCIITGIVQLAIIQYSMKAAGIFDVYFVNSLHLPFFSGFTFYFLALAAVITWALRFTEKKFSQPRVIAWFIVFLLLFTLPFFTTTGTGGEQIAKFLLIAGIGALAGYFFKPTGLKILKLSLWAMAFMMIGYFMYFTSMIRSNANPAIDMNNVDNPVNLVYYLSREQYGEAPLIYGPHFQAEYKQDPDSYNGISMKKGEMKYVKGKDRYIPIGTDDKPEYQSSDMQLFPRVWDGSNDQYHADFYAEWLNIGQSQDPQSGRTKYDAPTYADNINWFFSYQMSLMYWRYFMWNFAGKQNDIQGLGNKRDGNWITGISLIDNNRLGNQDKLPDSIKQNKAHNKLYLLPFILGIFGCVYQFLRKRSDWVANFLLFFMTGIAVVFYLNQPGNQPRERDYAFVGSFYAFAIWIGLAVVGFVKMAREKADKLTFQNVLIGGSILTFLVTFMSTMPAGNFGGDMLMTSIYATVLYFIITGGITLLVRAVSSGGQNAGVLNITTSVICLAVPILMGQQEWDDHDRSQKTLAPDIAKDYLESCAPNAILFTFGDNDTYPLWYAQEVEGVRPDIRIINNSLLGIDWYINQLRYKINDAPGIDVIWTEEQVEGHNREFLRYRAQGNKETYYDLYDVMKNVLGKPNIDEETKRDVGTGTFPVARFKVPVDTILIRKNGTVNPTETVLPELQFEIPQNKLSGGLVRSDLIILNIIASNGWKRPICFTSPFGELGFGQFLRKDGMSYRLVPVPDKYVQGKWIVDKTLRDLRLGGTQIKDDNTDFMYNNMMTKFEFGGAQKKGVYFDEENRRHLLGLRSLYGEAAGNMADLGRKEEAGKLLDKAEAGFTQESFPYALVSRYNSHNQTALLYLEACYKTGKMELADKVSKATKKDLEQQMDYYAAVGDMSRKELDNLLATYNNMISSAQQQADLSRAESYLADNLKEKQKGLKIEIIINNGLLKVFEPLEKKYLPQQAKTTVEGNNPAIITNPDSLGKKDSGNKPN